MDYSFLPEDQGLIERLKLNRKNVFFTMGIVAFFLLFHFLFLSAPGDFPLGEVVRIEKGSSLRSVSALLKREHVIRSRVAFESFAIIFGGEQHMVSADYLLDQKLSVWRIALRIEKGEHNLPPVSITVPEGFDIGQIAELASGKLINFNKANFLLLAKGSEGYLFPDTYFFLTNATEVDVLKSIKDNFTKKITPVRADIASSKKTEKDIITMASIIEREAKGDGDRATISGILWKRISLQIPLQVDAAPITYKERGLPNAPISNPGIESITAAIHPKSTPYLYYLHDKNGVIHYAKNFAEHTKNIQKYLR